MSDAISRFRNAMAKHIGRELTPEVAAQIEHEAFSEPDNSINPDRFEPIKHGDYTIRVERFCDIVDELDQLHRAHWLETEKYRHGLPLNPDYRRVLAMERAGAVVQYTIRHGRSPGGELVGHLRMYQLRSIHTQLPVAQEDAVFLHPKHRPNGHLVVALLRHAESVHRHLGAAEITATTKVVNDAGVMLRRLRYTHVANQFSKIL